MKGMYPDRWGHTHTHAHILTYKTILSHSFIDKNVTVYLLRKCLGGHKIYEIENWHEI